MSYFRTKKRENPFVQLDKTFLNDESISWSARGILAYILSKPDDWKIRQQDLINRSPDGKTKVERAKLELMAAGYLNWFQEKEEDGQFGEWVYEVYERPEFNPNKDECIKRGLEKLNEKKAKNKERNNKKKPKGDNQHPEPKVDNPIPDNPIPDNQPYSNNDFTDIELTNIEEEEEESQYNEIAILVNKNITEVNEVIKSSINEWLLKLPFDVIVFEIHNCIKRSAKSWMYVENTLNEDYTNGYDTVDKVKQKIEDHNSKKKAKKGNYSRKPVRQEKLPNWYDEKDQEAPTETDDSDDYDFEKEKAKLEQEIRDMKN
jgi:hypothetical protein